MEKYVSCVKISIDCIPSDDFDAESEKEYLGFDFYVREEEAESIEKFVKMVLCNFRIPVVSTKITGPVETLEELLYDKPQIVACIRREAGYLHNVLLERKEKHHI